MSYIAASALQCVICNYKQKKKTFCNVVHTCDTTNESRIHRKSDIMTLRYAVLSLGNTAQNAAIKQIRLPLHVAEDYKYTVFLVKIDASQSKLYFVEEIKK